MQLTKKHFGHYRYGWYLWELITDLDLSINEILEVQEREHYSVDCYWFYCPRKFKRTYNNGRVEFKYKWQSSTTSD